MAVSLNTNPIENAGGITPKIGQFVYANNTLNPTTWTVLPGCYIDYITSRTNGISSAQLSRPYGIRVKYPESPELGAEVPLIKGASLVDAFVRLELYSGITGSEEIVRFYGYVLAADNQRKGSDGSGMTGLPQGDQTFHVVGLEYFLDRVQLNGFFARNAATGRIEYHLGDLTFNKHSKEDGFSSQYKPLGNRERNNAITVRDPVWGNVSVYVFPGRHTDKVTRWSGWDILTYLIYGCLPRLPSTQYPLPITQWAINPSAKEFLENLFPVIETDNRTIFKVLNDLISPRRGLVWWLTYDNGNNIAQINVNSIIPSNLAFQNAEGNPEGDPYPSNETLPANPVQYRLNYDRDWAVPQSISRDNGARKYNQIIVRGAKRTVTATWSVASTTLTEGWPSFLQSDYLTKPTGDPKETDLNAVQTARMTEKYKDVFTKLVVAPDFNGLTNDGSPAGQKKQAFPALVSFLQEQQDVRPIPTAYGFKPLNPYTGVSYINEYNIRFLPNLPFREGTDYSQSTEKNQFQGDWIVAPLGGSEGDSYQSLIAMIPTAGMYPDQLMTKLEDLGKPAKLTAESLTVAEAALPQATVAHLVRPLEDGPGFRIEAADALNAHLTSGVFDIGADEIKPFLGSRQPGLAGLHYRDIRITATCEIEDYCQVSRDSLNPSMQGDVLMIDAGGNYRLDYLAPNTITGIDETTRKAKINAKGGVLRDDRPALARIADLAQAWYETEFHEISIQWLNIRTFTKAPNGAGDVINQPGLGLGDMITEIGWLNEMPPGPYQMSVSTVVTSITFNVEQLTSTYQTSYFDFPADRLP